DELLENLPSVQMYKELNEKAESYENTGCWSELESKLKSYITDNEDVNRIVKAFCYIYEMDENTRKNGGWCYYFYYWLGDMLPEGLLDFEFGTAMNIFWTKMEIQERKKKCEVLYTSNSKEVFGALKTVFDYKKDEKDLKEQLEGGGKKCTQNYYEHLRDIEKAYEKLKNDCKEKTMKEWHTAFTTKYGNYKSEQELQLKCELTDQKKAILHTADSAVEGTGTASIAVPSALVATVGLPTIAVFFLYKYNLLPSWIRDSFGGRSNRNNNRRKKRRSIKHEFDTPTEDSSTLYTTVADTSTIADLTDGSTVYNEPRGRNNGKVQHRNIRYQRM
ncbi:KIR-like protein, partial [Plasmodium coatneyi]